MANESLSKYRYDFYKNMGDGGGFEIPNYDYLAMTFVAAGNGAGEIETVVYKTGGSGGTTVATLTLAYDASDNLLTVTKT